MRRRRRTPRKPTENGTRKRRIDEMECVYGCGRTPNAGLACTECRDIEHLKAKTLYDERRAKGLCVRCGRKAVVSVVTKRPKVHCERHDRQRQILEDERRERRNEKRRKSSACSSASNG